MTRTNLILTTGESITVEGDPAAVQTGLDATTGRWVTLSSHGTRIRVHIDHVVKIVEAPSSELHAF